MSDNGSKDVETFTKMTGSATSPSVKFFFNHTLPESENEKRVQHNCVPKGDMSFINPKETVAMRDFESGDIVTSEPPVAYYNRFGMRGVNDPMDVFSEEIMRETRMGKFFGVVEPDPKSIDFATVQYAAEKQSEDGNLPKEVNVYLAKKVKEQRENAERALKRNQEKSDSTLEEHIDELESPEKKKERQENAIQSAADVTPEKIQKIQDENDAAYQRSLERKQRAQESYERAVTRYENKQNGIESAFKRLAQINRKILGFYLEGEATSKDRKYVKNRGKRAYFFPYSQNQNPQGRGEMFECCGSVAMKICRNILLDWFFKSKEWKPLEKVFPTWMHVIIALFGDHSEDDLIHLNHRVHYEGETLALFFEMQHYLEKVYKVDRDLHKSELSVSPEVSLKVIQKLWLAVLASHVRAESCIPGTKDMFFGAGIYRHASLYTHSCTPNTMLLVNHRTCTAVAIKEIKKGQPVTVNYGGLSGDYVNLLVEKPQIANELSRFSLFADGYQPLTLDEKKIFQKNFKLQEQKVKSSGKFRSMHPAAKSIACFRQVADQMPRMAGFSRRRATGCRCLPCVAAEGRGDFEIPYEEILKKAEEINNEQSKNEESKKGSKLKVDPKTGLVPFPVGEDEKAKLNNFYFQTQEFICKEVKNDLRERRMAFLDKKFSNRKNDEEQMKSYKEMIEETETILSYMQDECFYSMQYLFTQDEMEARYNMLKKSFVNKATIGYKDILSEYRVKMKKHREQKEESIKHTTQIQETKALIDKLTFESKQSNATKADEKLNEAKKLKKKLKELEKNGPLMDDPRKLSSDKGSFLRLYIQKRTRVTNFELIPIFLSAIMGTEFRSVKEEKSGLYPTMWNIVKHFAITRQVTVLKLDAEGNPVTKENDKGEKEEVYVKRHLLHPDDMATVERRKEKMDPKQFEIYMQKRLVREQADKEVPPHYLLQCMFAYTYVTIYDLLMKFLEKKGVNCEDERKKDQEAYNIYFAKAEECKSDEEVKKLEEQLLPPRSYNERIRTQLLELDDETKELCFDAVSTYLLGITTRLPAFVTHHQFQLLPAFYLGYLQLDRKVSPFSAIILQLMLKMMRLYIDMSYLSLAQRAIEGKRAAKAKKTAAE